MSFMFKQVQKLTIVLLMWVSLLVFILMTHPERLPLPLLVTPFLLLIAVLYVSARFMLTASFKDISAVRVKTMSLIFAMLPTLLLLLASIRQLSMRDSAIIIGLLILLLFYFRRLDFLAK